MLSSLEYHVAILIEPSMAVPRWQCRNVVLYVCTAVYDSLGFFSELDQNPRSKRHCLVGDKSWNVSYAFEMVLSWNADGDAEVGLRSIDQDLDSLLSPGRNWKKKQMCAVVNGGFFSVVC